MEEEKAVNELIANYLRQRGFTQAHDSFKRELQKDSTSIEQYAAQRILDKQTSMLRSVLSYTMSESSPDWFTESYKYLKRWIESSLDLYRVVGSVYLL